MFCKENLYNLIFYNELLLQRNFLSKHNKKQLKSKRNPLKVYDNIFGLNVCKDALECFFVHIACYIRMMIWYFPRLPKVKSFSFYNTIFLIISNNLFYE